MSSRISNNLGIGINADQSIVSASTISNNSGSGIHANTAIASFSTISNNLGSGIDANETVVSSTTISNNLAGEIDARGMVAVKSSTIVGNELRGGEVSLRNSIVTAVTGSSLDVRYSLISYYGGPLLTESPVGAPNEKGNLIGGDQYGPIDPMVAPLADNGGSTFTHALLPGSPAIDAGDPSSVPGEGDVPTFDQRGELFGRAIPGLPEAEGRIDMGAYERPLLWVEFADVSPEERTNVDSVSIHFSLPVSGLGLGDFFLSRNGSDDLLTEQATLTTNDSQTFLLSNLSNVTSSIGFYRLLIVDSHTPILDPEGRTLDASPIASWSTGHAGVDIIVDTLDDEADYAIDDGDVSLRDAIAAAESGDVIGFSPALADGTIELMKTLTLTRRIMLDATGLSAPPVVVAPPSDVAPTFGLNNSPIFAINDGSYWVDSAIAIRGLSLRGGQSVYSEESVTLEETIVEGDRGGAFPGIQTRRNATIVASEISGGGVHAEGNIRVESSTLTENNYAIWAAGNVTVVGSSIHHNKAYETGYGGVSVLATGDLNIVDSVIHQNYGSTTSYGDIWLADSSITENRSSLHARGDIRVERTTISGNSGDGLQAGGHTAIHSSSILSNLGGGVRSSYDVEIDSTTISANSGEGVKSSGGSVTVVRSIVSDNERGGVASHLDLVVTYSTVIANSSNFAGGGLLSEHGDITVRNSTIQGNTAPINGGGIALLRGGTVTVYSSTVSENEAGEVGGGIALLGGGTLVVDTTTISANEAGQLGGGVYVLGSARITSTVVYNNRAGDVGGGIFAAPGDLDLANTIVAANTSVAFPELPDVLGTMGIAHHNLIGFVLGTVVAESPIGSPDANGNLIGGPIHGAIDPLLGPLDDNGGLTWTHALLPGSPAINAGEPLAAAGVNGVPLFDQRGEPYARIRGGRIDIGAFELQVGQSQLPGDYNHDGTVDAADYTVWKDHFGETLMSMSASPSAIAPTSLDFDVGHRTRDFDVRDAVFAHFTRHTRTRHRVDGVAAIEHTPIIANTLGEPKELARLRSVSKFRDMP